MQNEVSKSLFCILMRNGIEIWREQEEIKKLQEVLTAIKNSTFIHFGNMTINTADITGIFDAITMSEHTQRKNGKWKCEFEEWHDKFAKCECDNYLINLKKKYGDKVKIS